MFQKFRFKSISQRNIAYFKERTIFILQRWIVSNLCITLTFIRTRKSIGRVLGSPVIYISTIFQRIDTIRSIIIIRNPLTQTSIQEYRQIKPLIIKSIIETKSYIWTLTVNDTIICRYDTITIHILYLYITRFLSIGSSGSLFTQLPDAFFLIIIKHFERFSYKPSIRLIL